MKKVVSIILAVLIAASVFSVVPFTTNAAETNITINAISNVFTSDSKIYYSSDGSHKIVEVSYYFNIADRIERLQSVQFKIKYDPEVLSFDPNKNGDYEEQYNVYDYSKMFPIARGLGDVEILENNCIGFAVSVWNGIKLKDSSGAAIPIAKIVFDVKNTSKVSTNIVNNASILTLINPKSEEEFFVCYPTKQISQELIFDYISKYYPQYLDNSVYNGYRDAALRICNDALQHNDKSSTNILRAFAEGFVNGDKILIKELFSSLGVGQSTQEEWLEENTLDFISEISSSENYISSKYNKISKKYKDFKTTVKAIDLADTVSYAAKKAAFIKELSDKSSVLDKEQVEELADKLFEEKEGIKFFDLADYVVDAADILSLSLQMLDVEESVLQDVMNNIDTDSLLYKGLSENLVRMRNNPVDWVITKYFDKEVLNKMVGLLGEIKNGFLSLTNGGLKKSLTLKVVTTISSILYKYVWKYSKIDDINGAIQAYDFLTTIRIAKTNKLNQIFNCYNNGTVPSDELLNNYSDMFCVEESAMKHYANTCKKLEEKSSDHLYLSSIESICDDLDNIYSFENYITCCFNALKNDINIGEIPCSHNSIEMTFQLSPNCMSGGFDIMRCDYCGYSWRTNNTSALGHSYCNTVVSPTCTTQGYTTHKCSRCSSSFTDSYVNAKGHSAGDTLVVYPPSSDNDGLSKTICADCGSIIKQDSIPYLSISDVEVIEGSTYTLKYMLPKETAQSGYTDYSITIRSDTTEKTVSEYYVDGDNLVFVFDNLTKDDIKGKITAVLSAELYNIHFTSDVFESELKNSFKLTDNFNWGTAYVYAWDSDNNLICRANPAKRIVDDSGVAKFVVEVPEGASRIVINNGSGSITESITDFTTFDCYWMDGTRNSMGHYKVTGYNRIDPQQPTTEEPTEAQTTVEPTTAEPTEEPTTVEPTTAEPTEEPTIELPTTAEPTEDPSTEPTTQPDTVEKQIVNGIYYENGVAKNPGLVRIGNDFYYTTSGGKIVYGDQTIYSSRTNGLLPGGVTYHFDEVTGKLYKDNVIIDDVYYKEGAPKNVGIVKVAGAYYVTTTKGVITKDAYNKYIASSRTNGLVAIGYYDFGPDGKMILKNGIIGGKYYVNGKDTNVGLFEYEAEGVTNIYCTTTGGVILKDVTNKYIAGSRTNGLAKAGYYSFDSEGRMIR